MKKKFLNILMRKDISKSNFENLVCQYFGDMLVRIGANF